MRMVLTGIQTISSACDEKFLQETGFTALKVLYCAVCRTDAKMWQEGHRDLVLPRVLGHELVAEDEKGERYTVWPGKSCGQCRYCCSGRDNLCEKMEIVGFHRDGGFAREILVPDDSLIPVPRGIPDHLGCFAEPVGCVLHAFGNLRPATGQRIVIYGGGTLGLIAALTARAIKAKPLVIEKSAEKIERIRPFLDAAGITCDKDTTESEFDLALNACPDPVALSQCVVKLGKGGKLAFFSGLNKNKMLETNLINLMHYKEIECYGTYGLMKKNMEAAIGFIKAHGDILDTLVEAILPPEKIQSVMPLVLSGARLKYIIAFSSRPIGAGKVEPVALKACKDKKAEGVVPQSQVLPPNQIEPVNQTLQPAAQHKIDNKTKPLGALGKIEDLALKMSLIQDDLTPRINRKALFVFAADHGVAELGVSAYPAEVTEQMVLNFTSGGAAINVLCRHHQIDLSVVDMGVKGELAASPMLVSKKIRKGTRNLAVEAAMTTDEAVSAIRGGMDVFFDEQARKPIDILGLGEMGIGNTTAATAIISAVTGVSPEAVTGRGTGVDDKGLEHKAKTIKKALAFHRLDAGNGMDILCKVGGYEVAGIVGAALAATSQKTAVVLDGLISTAAGLIAYLICPDIKGYLFSGHKSTEAAQKAALDYMGLDPLIDLSMRLGEGTGAALAMDLIESACKIMEEMASFEEAGVSRKEERGKTG